MWSAVFQMEVECPKYSIHRLLCAGIQQLSIAAILDDSKSVPAKAEHEMKALLEGVDVIIVDEVSTQAIQLFVALHKYLSKASGDPRPFGGFSIVLLGDFCQNPPTCPKITLAEALVTFSLCTQQQRVRFKGEEKLAMEAAALFRPFERIMLTEQTQAGL